MVTCNSVIDYLDVPNVVTGLYVYQVQLNVFALLVFFYEVKMKFWLLIS